MPQSTGAFPVAASSSPRLLDNLNRAVCVWMPVVAGGLVSVYYYCLRIFASGKDFSCGFSC